MLLFNKYLKNNKYFVFKILDKNIFYSKIIKLKNY